MPIVLGTITVPLAVAMLVAWTVLFVRSQAFTGTWLMVLGIISLSAIATVLVLLSVFLAREIIEVRRQVSFIDSVTHELKSPLASLKLNLQTLERDLSPEQALALRRMMMADIERLAIFIDDVLVAHRVAHARPAQAPHNLGRIGLRELTERCRDRVAQRHEVPPEAIRVDIPTDLVVVADLTVIETILNNLVDNAVKYSDPPVEVRVTARRVTAGAVELDVTDRGIGIALQDQKRIFQRFYRAPGEAVRARRGTGLGLFVVQALVRELGGRLGATSEGIGRGTTFHLVLPPRLVEQADG